MLGDVIDVQQLRILVELPRLGTVSVAAESLGFSQSIVSHQPATLSRATGVVLLTRAGRGVRLTGEGRTLVVRGQEVLDLLERIEREVVSMARVEAGRVRLAAFPSAMVSLIPGMFDVAGRQYPGLKVELVDTEPSEALEALRRGRVDVALSFPYISDDAGEGLQAKHLLDDVLHLVIYSGGITRIADGAQRRWVTGCARCREELPAVGRVNGFTSEIAYASDDYVAAQVFVAAGVGAALLPGMVLSVYRHEGVQVWSLVREQRHVEVVIRAERSRPLAINALVETCQVAARRTSLRRPAVTTSGSTASQ